jgi:uridine kinase
MPTPKSQIRSKMTSARPSRSVAGRRRSQKRTVTKKIQVIGITGASASGKSTFAENLAEILGKDKCVLISQDNFYKPAKTIRENGDPSQINWDEPNSIDYDAFNRVLNDLKTTKKGQIPNYSFAKSDVDGYTSVTLKPSACYIIVEGIFAMNNQELYDAMDLRVFIDTSLDLCLARRIARDVAHRGATVESTIAQYTRDVRPGYFNFIEPKKVLCDMIVPNDMPAQYKRALHVVSNHLANACK